MAPFAITADYLIELFPTKTFNRLGAILALEESRMVVAMTK